MRNLVVAVLGSRNSGKTHTWNSLFGQTVKTGKHERVLDLGKGDFVNVFLVSGSPEERQTSVGDILGDSRPRIVLCSMQYIESVKDTLGFFGDNDYFLFLHWLNPGHHDAGYQADYLGLYHRIQHMDSMTGIRDGSADAAERVRETCDFIRGWASGRGLTWR